MKYFYNMCKEHFPKSILENICVSCEKEIVYIPDYFPTIHNDKDYRKTASMGMSDYRSNGWLLKSIALHINQINNIYNIKVFRRKNNYNIQIKFSKEENTFNYVIICNYNLDTFYDFELYFFPKQKIRYAYIEKSKNTCTIVSFPFEEGQDITCNVNNLQEGIVFLEKLMSNIEFL